MEGFFLTFCGDIICFVLRACISTSIFSSNIQVGGTRAEESFCPQVPKGCSGVAGSERFPHWREHDVSWDEGQNREGAVGDETLSVFLSGTNCPCNQLFRK